MGGYGACAPYRGLLLIFPIEGFGKRRGTDGGAAAARARPHQPGSQPGTTTILDCWLAAARCPLVYTHRQGGGGAKEY